ncbi:MAG: hypothetical protein OIN84_13040, partial [Candidatus Methanoperedens sp.]|nr:hypothetical protein [Candidatus Methanoperedens sp.]
MRNLWSSLLCQSFSPYTGEKAGRRWWISVIGLLLLLMLFIQAVSAQSNSEGDSWQVFLERDRDDLGFDRLIFVDAVTGEEIPVEVFGERYTLVGGYVMFYDPANDRVMVTSPTSITREHPFIQPGGGTRRVDWQVSPDSTLIAWTLTNGDSASALSTVTTVSNLDGTNPRQVLVDGPRAGIRALPVAFSADNRKLYLDFQPDGIGALTPFQQYAGLFQVDLATGEQDYLPDEPGCFCGAGLNAGLFLRLALTNDLTGFNVEVYNLIGEVDQTIPALALENFTQAGDILISPDGLRAVYALAQVRNFGSQNESVRTVFVLVNLEDMTQAALTEPITTYVQPVAWTEDDSAVIFTSPERDGTWKVSLSDGTLVKIAEATYVGVL